MIAKLTNNIIQEYIFLFFVPRKIVKIVLKSKKGGKDQDRYIQVPHLN